MQKRMKRFRRHHELSFWVGNSDQGGWDQFRSLLIIASSPEHAVHVFWKGMLNYDESCLYTLTKEQILSHLEDAYRNGAPIPKMWEKYLPEVEDTCGEDIANWTWENVGKPAPRFGASIAMTDFHNG
uniref:Uncharacterized protein n=1 Tax=Pseudomonas phage RVTF4 TaxID=3236931 RepID=A0AB39CCV9_9VIRU